MQRMNSVISYVLSSCLLFLQIFPAYTALRVQEPVRVVYLGLYFDGITPEKQAEIDGNIFFLLDSEPGLFTISAETIDNRLDEEIRNRIKMNPQNEDLREAAGLLDADHIFTGVLENQSRDEEYIALVGNLIRYDSAADQLYSLQIQSFYEDFDRELGRLHTQLIQTILPEEKKSFFRRYLPGILIVAATAVAVAILLSGTDGQSTGQGPGPTPPVTTN